MNLRRCRLFASFALLAGFLTSARGQINLANYSSNNPVKIMCIGDSITDDCETPGAWRQYLQPLLDNSGYPFIFVGRNHSTPKPPTFTQTAHEGYCGAVIAPPGVLTSPVYQYAGTNVDLEFIVPDALAANTPDIILLLIGANDIGRGRNPGTVASNDIPNLLDEIFSIDPHVNIICAKITSLTGGNIAGITPPYGTYSGNVYLYNAYLQNVINQRRAQGQNVWLADMFSVVNPTNMFMPDHVHPNASGLQAVAQEWFTRIQAMTIFTNQFTTTLIHGGDVWSYNDTGQDLGTNWSQTNYDDSAWSNGLARLGYNGAGDNTTVSFGGNVTNRNITTYFLHPIVMPSHAVLTNLQFRVQSEDGDVAYFDGVEVYRSNMPLGPITYTNTAASSLSLDFNYIFYPSNYPLAAPLSGTHVAAVEVHKVSALKAVMSFDAEVLGMGYYIPTPAISINSGNVQLSWPVNNSASFSLYAAPDVTSGAWSNTFATLQTNGSTVTASLPLGAATQFFRLQP
jgi:lysophospholipase L1-like esterase